MSSSPEALHAALAQAADCVAYGAAKAPAREEPEAPPEKVNHPPHYIRHPSGVECIDIVEHMSFNVGNAMKYLWRADHKNGDEDLRKAAWCIQRELQLRQAH